MTRIDVALRPFHFEITATTTVEAPPEQVWQVLTATAEYPDWNPFIRRFEGQVAVGERVEVDLQPARRPVSTIRPRIVDVQPGRGFTWLGRLGLPGVLDRRHQFSIEPEGQGTRLIQHEVLSGVLTPAFRAVLTRDTTVALAALNDALAERAEARAGARSEAPADDAVVTASSITSTDASTDDGTDASTDASTDDGTDDGIDSVDAAGPADAELVLGKPHRKEAPGLARQTAAAD